MRKPQQIWLLWHKAKAYSTTASSLLGVEQGTYEAYCLDEAVVYFGTSLENMLDEAGQKQDKAARKAQAARERLLDKVFDDGKQDKGSGFADPAAMFN